LVEPNLVWAKAAVVNIELPCVFGVAEVRMAMFELMGPGDARGLVCLLVTAVSSEGLAKWEEEEDVDADEEGEDNTPKSVC